MKCSRCRSRRPAKGLAICNRCRRYFKTWSRNRVKQDKQACMTEYGKNSGCVCCGVKEISFLSIDHIKDDGFKKRDKHGLGKHLYRMLVKMGFPRGFQVLCFNCQWGKRLNGGFCPHHPQTDLRKNL